MSPKIKLGHFRNFKSEPQMILFSGDKEAIYRLEEVFHKLSKGVLQSVRLDQLDFIVPLHNLQIYALSVPGDLGLKRRKGSNSFVWSLSAETWEDFAELISVFQSGNQGHHYLDCYSSDKTRIMVSQGEYPNDLVWWTK